MALLISDAWAIVLEDVPLLPVFSIDTYDCRRIPPDVLLSFRL